MVKLRLKRMGRKKRPFYRIVAMDVTRPRDGQALSQLGTYDPLLPRVTLDEDALAGWLKNGAQMTPTVRDLLKSQGVLARIQGLEGKVREDALTGEKPKRRKKLAGAVATAAETAEVESAEPESPQAESPQVESAEPERPQAESPAPEAVEAQRAGEAGGADDSGGAKPSAETESSDEG